MRRRDCPPADRHQRSESCHKLYWKERPTKLPNQPVRLPAPPARLLSLLEDGIAVVKRVAKKSGDAAEEFMDDTTKRLERHLVVTVAATFAIGVVSGVLIGWMLKRK